MYTYTTAGTYTVTLTVTDTDTAETDTAVAASYIQVSLPTTVISYEYDDLYRLTGADYTGAISATYAYEYDSVGNMTAFTETVTSTRTVERTFDGANQLITSFDVDAGTTSFYYDGNGNLVQELGPGTPTNQLVRSYQYNQRNLLVDASSKIGTLDGPRTVYHYDGAGNRVRELEYDGGPVTPVEPSRVITYTNDIVGLTEVLVADDGASQVYNLFGLDLTSQDGGSGVRTLLGDGLGSVRLELASGAVEAATTYSPYGEVLAESGTSGTVYGFTGEQEDSATGLLYLRARYYNSSLKVFQSRDPWEGTGWRPETLNYYVYGSDNPVGYVDPTGKFAVCFQQGSARAADVTALSQICNDLATAGAFGPSGQSKVVDSNMQGAISALEWYEQIRQLYSSEMFVVMGYSWGGSAALEFTWLLNDHYPDTAVDALVLIDAVRAARGIPPFSSVDRVIDPLRYGAMVPFNVRAAINLYATENVYFNLFWDWNFTQVYGAENVPMVGTNHCNIAYASCPMTSLEDVGDNFGVDLPPALLWLLDACGYDLSEEEVPFYTSPDANYNQATFDHIRNWLNLQRLLW